MMEQHQPLLERSQKLLADRFSQDVTLTITAEIPGNFFVLRCQLTPVLTGLSPSVIVKQTPMDDETTRNRVLNEIACLEFLAELETETKLAPTLYAYDSREGIVVLEDLGERPSLMDLLHDENQAAAEAQLLAYGRFFAQLHVATQGKEAQFRHMQQRLGAASPLSDATVVLANYKEPIQQLLDAIGLSEQADFWQEFAQLVAAITAEKYRTFIHCDSGPQNMLVLADGVLLLDYEFGDYGHALLDVAGWRNGFQQSGKGQRLPPEMITAVEATYRAELIKAMPDLAQDALFYDAVVCANAHWTIGRLAHFWSAYLQKRLEQGVSYDDRWLTDPDKAKLFRRFQQQGMLTLIDSFIDTSHELDHLPAMREAVQKIQHLLQTMWPDVPQLPCFAAWSQK
jgi:tRNA A-37 threonylcarbamoyl transferase component Bud32